MRNQLLKTLFPEKGAIFQRDVSSLWKEFTGGICLNKILFEFVQTITEKEIVQCCMGTEQLTNVAGTHKKNLENSSQLVCNVCVRKIKNCYDKLKFLPKRFESDQKGTVGGEFEIVYVRARKQSDV